MQEALNGPHDRAGRGREAVRVRGGGKNLPKSDSSAKELLE